VRQKDRTQLALRATAERRQTPHAGEKSHAIEAGVGRPPQIHGHACTRLFSRHCVDDDDDVAAHELQHIARSDAPVADEHLGHVYN
jgi:hypothetical protein